MSLCDFTKVTEQSSSEIVHNKTQECLCLGYTIDYQSEVIEHNYPDIPQTRFSLILDYFSEEITTYNDTIVQYTWVFESNISWLSEDPAHYKDGLNLYHAYFGVNYADPLGLWITEEEGKVLSMYEKSYKLQMNRANKFLKEKNVLLSLSAFNSAMVSLSKMTELFNEYKVYSPVPLFKGYISLPFTKGRERLEYYRNFLEVEAGNQIYSIRETFTSDLDKVLGVGQDRPLELEIQNVTFEYMSYVAIGVYGSVRLYQALRAIRSIKCIDKFLHGKSGQTLDKINKIGSDSNCGSCGVATAQTLSGSPASAIATGKMSRAAIQEAMKSSTPFTFSNMSNIIKMLIKNGQGARTIIAADRADDVGHVFVMLYHRNNIILLDPQTGKIATGLLNIAKYVSGQKFVRFFYMNF